MNFGTELKAWFSITRIWIFQNQPRIRTLLFGRKSTDLITPTKRIVEEDEQSERSQKPARYTTPSKPVKEYRSPQIDDDTDIEDEPKLKVKEHVSKINFSLSFLICTPCVLRCENIDMNYHFSLTW